MKQRKTLAVLVCALMLLLALAGCESGQPDSAPQASPQAPAPNAETSAAPSAPESQAAVVTDMTGRTISLDEPVTRIVALNPADCEILYALGAEDTLVGRGTYCDYPEQVLDIAQVGSGEDMSVEQVMALKPQVVLMSSMAHSPEQIKALEDAGAKVVVSEATDIEGAYEAIALIGAVAGKNSEAQTLIADMKAAFADIKSRSAGDGGKTIYFEVSPLQYGLWTAGKNTFMDEFASMLGLTNAFADVDGWAEISQEQVIERDPDYIVTITMYSGEGPDPVDEIAGRKGWQSMKAVKNGAILNADSDAVARPGPRLVDAARELYEFVYGTMAEKDAA